MALASQVSSCHYLRPYLSQHTAEAGLLVSRVLHSLGQSGAFGKTYRKQHPENLDISFLKESFWLFRLWRNSMWRLRNKGKDFQGLNEQALAFLTPLHSKKLCKWNKDIHNLYRSQNYWGRIGTHIYPSCRWQIFNSFAEAVILLMQPQKRYGPREGRKTHPAYETKQGALSSTPTGRHSSRLSAGKQILANKRAYLWLLATQSLHINVCYFILPH